MCMIRIRLFSALVFFLQLFLYVNCGGLKILTRMTVATLIGQSSRRADFWTSVDHGTVSGGVFFSSICGRWSENARDVFALQLLSIMVQWNKVCSFFSKSDCRRTRSQQICIEISCVNPTQNTKNPGIGSTVNPPVLHVLMSVVKASYAELLQVINVPFRELMDMLADIDRVPSRNSGGLLVGCGRVGFGVFECRGF